MDLSLHDALTDGAPKSGPDSLVRRDFMASLEKETFDDKVGETVGKTDYRPLLDGKDGKGSSMMPGGQMGTRMPWQEPMGEKHPCPTGQQSAVNSDYLSGPVSSMMGIPGDQWGNQNKGMKDSNIPDSLMGFSQPGMMNMNMGSGGMGGMAPFQTGMPPMGNSQKASPLFASEPHKQSQSQAPFKPNDSYPSAPGHNTQSQDNSAVWTNPNPLAVGESGLQASEGLSLSPSDSVEESPNSDPLSPHGQETGSGDERGTEGVNSGSMQQKRKKKKRRPREEVYDFMDREEAPDSSKEEEGETESGASDCPLSLSSPSKEESWECEIRGRGGGRVRGRKNKSRMKLPEEWGPTPQEPTTPHATPASVSAMVMASGPLSSTLENISSLIADPQTNPFSSFIEDTKPSHTSTSPPLTENPKPSHILNKDPALTDTSTSNLNMFEQPSPAKVNMEWEAEAPVKNTASAPLHYEPMCIDDFKMPPPVATKDVLPPNKEEAALSFTDKDSSDHCRREANASITDQRQLGPKSSPGFSPQVSQTSFLDSVLQTPSASTPASQPQAQSQTTTPQGLPPNTTTSSSFQCTSPPLLSHSSQPDHDTHSPRPAVCSGLNPAAPPFIPTTLPLTEHQEPPLPEPPLLEVKAENKDKQEKADFFPKMDNLNMFDKTEKSDKMEKMENKEKKDQSKKVNADKTNKSEILKDEERIDKTEKNVKNEKVDKPEKTNKDEKMEKKANGENTDKMVKVEKNEKKGTAKSPTTIRSKQDLTSPDSKAKPAVGSTKPNSVKTRPTSLSTGDAAAPLKRSAPTSSSANKKSPVTKATTPTAGTKRPTVAPSQTPTASKSKTPENGTSDRRPPVPKANGTANKDSSSTTATTKPAGPRPSANVPSLRRNTVPKTDIKPGDVKKPTTLKTTPAKPRVPHTSATAPSTPATNGEQPRRRITKPPVPKQTAMERKPAVPRAPRTPRPINAPLPDLKNVRSKIGSTDNMKYQSTGGKVSSAGGSQSKDGQGKVMIVHKKLDFSHITSRCGSKDNIKHVPGGGNVQIQHKKVDLSKVTSKCGSKDNIKHKPGVSTTGGGDVKIEAKANGNGKPKVGSMDNIGLEAEDGQNKAGGMQEKAEGKTSPPGGPPATGARSVAKENGHKEATPHPNPFGGDGLRDPIGMGMDKRIPETTD
ncbi:microtubule-associated protein 4-like isoform X1 [Oncorhynchus keta]|uniref:microtubule-associated protein 4-like isoform X1 n=1 Tax=Oncorhynchus keta TaxID=8018 RepID=UPI0015F9B280|nr:microtubule-associated protein 4-like isoform X1 [Oncorhynchus keta]